jgi:hypothetical protein
MGKRKFLTYFLFFILLSQIHSEDIVGDIGFHKDGILIRFEHIAIFNVNIKNIEIFNNDYSHVVFINPNLIDIIDDNTLLIKLNEQKVIINERYHIIINAVEFLIHIYSFIGNPAARLEQYYVFPLIQVPNMRILIINVKKY